MNFKIQPGLYQKNLYEVSSSQQVSKLGEKAAQTVNIEDKVELTKKQEKISNTTKLKEFSQKSIATTPSGKTKFNEITPDSPLFDHIHRMWDVLKRNCIHPESLIDEKSGHKPVLYVPENEKLPEIDGIEVRTLPRDGKVEANGLLYVPNDYVVPGGRFNEMYGWDSHFTALGLLEDGKTELAKDMTENLFYEIDHYGKVLNANRTYYIQRSNPPFLGSTILEIYKKTGDRAWLLKALPYAIKEHDFWLKPPRITPTGLSRYHAEGKGPCPEVEPGYYDNLPTRPEFYVHDRAERESGWDMTDRYGYRCADYNPVCLNSLLYKEEKDIAEIYRLLEGEDSKNAGKWEDKASKRKELINKYCWDEEKGIYVDYDFVNGKKSNYESMATFYPLYAGVASPRQAAKVMQNLTLFEEAGGLSTS
ncbi:MAG: hypothetical protein J7M18_00470, partial [Candidatus Eremiobacteraeota bacterium]|nr:hypothetical protein [Candidatus Eremiobacteraeota bacterium]